MRLVAIERRQRLAAIEAVRALRAQSKPVSHEEITVAETVYDEASKPDSTQPAQVVPSSDASSMLPDLRPDLSLSGSDAPVVDEAMQAAVSDPASELLSPSQQLEFEYSDAAVRVSERASVER